MKLDLPKEWFEQSAKIEGDSEVGAGCPDRNHPHPMNDMSQVKLKLKPCPFCGGTPEGDHARGFIDYRGRPSSAVAIYCLDCEAEFSICHGDFEKYTPEQMMEVLSARWNRRTP